MKLILMVCIVLFGGCSSLNNLNKNTHSKLILKSGKSKELTWSDSLSFTRNSWYDGVTLKYDILYTKLTKNSPFSNWIGQVEREQFEKCESYYIMLVYSQFSQSASRSELMTNFDIVGLKRISTPVFESHFRNHSFNNFWKLHRHSLYGICKTKDLSSIEVAIPNFTTVKVLE